MIGAKILVECLKKQGVDIIFGFPGGAVLPIYDELYKEKDITHILTAHEQGATHAADGYARSTGKIGVVIATSGPGATNTVTGIATAYMDSVPLIIFTGQVPTSLLGKSSFQEVNITDITKSITKKNYIVKDAKQLPFIISEAFSIAKSGKPGPVLIDLPKDIQIQDAYYDASMHTEYHSNSKEFIPNILENTLKAAAKAINNSKKPVIYAGGGVNISGANEELLKFSEKIKAPVTLSLMGMGAFPGNNKNYMGMVGMHGSKYSNYAVSESDLLIAIGARFSDRVISKVESFAPNAKIIHIDIDPMEFGKNIGVDYALLGDVKKVLNDLNNLIDEKEENGWNAQIEKWKNEFPLKLDKVGDLSPKSILETLYNLTNGDCIISTEVGQNQIWAAQFFKYINPRTFVSSGGLGTMGFGLGASIGAKLGNPHKKVINIAGDGSFKMNSTELATISRYNIPIIQIVFNNHALGMVRQWQDMFYDKRYSSTTLYDDVDFVKLAYAYGISAYKITKDEEIEDILKLALNEKGPVLIECVIDNNEKVFPIVPPGAAISKCIE
ncbi:MAG: biosynthetic-type acetolactate synthase large subunit [Clostridiaceae bacterium]